MVRVMLCIQSLPAEQQQKLVLAAVQQVVTESSCIQSF